MAGLLALLPRDLALPQPRFGSVRAGHAAIAAEQFLAQVYTSAKFPLASAHR